MVTVPQGFPCPGVTYSWAAVLQDCTSPITEHLLPRVHLQPCPQQHLLHLVPSRVAAALKHSSPMALGLLWLAVVLVHNEALTLVSEPARTGCDQPVHGSSWSPPTPVTTGHNPASYAKYNSRAIFEQYNVTPSRLKRFNNIIHCILSSLQLPYGTF